MSDPNFEAESQLFIKWLTSNGVIINPGITLTDLRHLNKGRGVVTNTPISTDAVLFSIPRSTLLDASNSNFIRDHNDILSDLEDPWLQLILTLMYEQSQKQNSKWFAYLTVLPTTFNTLMYWTPSELAELQSSPVLRRIGKDEANSLFVNRLVPIVSQTPASFGVEGIEGLDLEAIVLEKAHWAASAIMAYAFDVDRLGRDVDEDGYQSDESDEDLPKAMVPLADMLNADADLNNAKLFYEGDVLEMRAIRDIEGGEEIYNDYGPLPRSELLRRYGYVTQNYAKYDVVEIPTALLLDTACSTFNVPAESAQNAPADIPDGFDLSGPGSEDDGIETLKDDFLRPFLKSVGVEPSSLNWKLWLYNTIIKVQEGYSTVLGVEKQHLRNEQDDRKRMAIEVRIGEKELLQSLRDKLESSLGSNGSVTERGQPPSKRLRR